MGLFHRKKERLDLQEHRRNALEYIAYCQKIARERAAELLRQRQQQLAERKAKIQDTEDGHGVQYSLRTPDERIPTDYSDLKKWLETNAAKATFQSVLMDWIEKKGISSSRFYKRAGFDRKLFSEMKNNRFYHPTKNTAIRCCFALELTLEETQDLMELAGYAFSDGVRSDLILRYCLRNGIWNLDDVNDLLYTLQENTLF